MNKLLFLFLLSLALLQSGAPSETLAAASASYDWMQFAFDAAHSGNDTLETTLTAANVNQLARRYQITLPAVADGAPAFLAGVTTAQGVMDLVFVTTRPGHIVALNAATGAQVWVRQYPAGGCLINMGTIPCYTTSSPAVDPNRKFVYSYGLDGRLHKLQVGDGIEVKVNGWPERATRKGFNEKGSSALSIATARNGVSFLYVTNGGYPGDRGDYQGHVTAINLSDGSQHVFNTMCSNQVDVHFRVKPALPSCGRVQSAIWARPGVIYDSGTDRIYMSTGNGTFNPARFHWGDTVFALNPNGTGVSGRPLDSYTPVNYLQLQASDTDLGSTAPAILPVPAGSTVAHLAVQSGKDGKLRLLNLDNLSGQGGPGHTGGEVGPIINVPQGGAVLTQPAVWVNPADGTAFLFVSNGSGISELQLGLNANDTPVLQPRWQSAAAGTSPIVANNVLYCVGSGHLRALDPVSGVLLWEDAAFGSVHWQSPIVANGVLFVTDNQGKLSAYSLNGK